ERANTHVDVLAPAAWTNARVAAWIDWAGGDADLPAAIFRFAEELVQQGEARRLFDSARTRAAFRRDLGAAMLSGAVVVARGASSRLSLPRLTGADEPGFQPTLDLF